MEHKVTGCSDCPMFTSENDDRYGWLTNCQHPNFKSKGVVEEIDVDDKGNSKTPDDCPLNSEPITIIKQ